MRPAKSSCQPHIGVGGSQDIEPTPATKQALTGEFTLRPACMHRRFTKRSARHMWMCLFLHISTIRYHLSANNFRHFGLFIWKEGSCSQSGQNGRVHTYRHTPTSKQTENNRIPWPLRLRKIIDWPSATQSEKQRPLGVSSVNA